MRVVEVREKYIKFFERKEHKAISAAPLVVENDPSTLFTSAGMQPLVPYLMGEEHPEGKRLVNSQPSIRTQDIDEVGDLNHTTYFEMLGNWSLGDYFKAEQLAWIWEFLTEELKLPKDKLWVTVFEGNDEVECDKESVEIWKKLGVSEERIRFYGVKKNWWSRSGTPEQMPAGEIGGPTSEVFYEFDMEHDPKHGKKCHPNCDCGKFWEIGNSVFMVYKKTKKGLEELPNKNVDFGGGLERMTAATNNDPDIFKIDVFADLIKRIEEVSGKKYEGNEKEMRIIADHVRASVFLMRDGVVPSNKQQGYVLRRLLRRSATKAFVLNRDFSGKEFRLLGRLVIDNYPVFFEGVDQKNIEDGISLEIRKYRATLEKGLKEMDRYFETLKNEGGWIPVSEENLAKKAFMYEQSYGIPRDEILERIQGEYGFILEMGKFSVDKFEREVEKEFERHQEKSRVGSAGKFKGGLADASVETTALHTATHLLHASLRKVLGEHVMQRGSNITAERLRFDFSHGEKLTEEQIKEIEELINEQIEMDLEVSAATMTLGEAKKKGALALFGDKYDEKVKVYTIGDPTKASHSDGQVFSREVCGGPHVQKLSEMGGRVRIKKQEAASSGVRRVYAEIV